MHAQDLMTHPAVTCHVNESLAIAAHRMWEHGCGALPVVNDDGVVTGMITDRDICMAACTQGRALDALLVNGVMARHVITVGPGERIEQVAELMATHKIRRIPIVDGDGRPIGIVSLDDLALESVQPDTRMRHALPRIAHTLAAICQPRTRPAKRASLG
jgi:CBS domain-containing protein